MMIANIKQKNNAIATPTQKQNGSYIQGKPI
jgi:hypothetical protein